MPTGYKLNNKELGRKHESHNGFPYIQELDLHSLAYSLARARQSCIKSGPLVLEHRGGEYQIVIYSNGTTFSKFSSKLV